MPRVCPLDSLPEYIQAAIRDPELGSRVRCHVCDGGTSREDSLTIRETAQHGMIKLSCWRSTCGYWALVLLDGTIEFSAKKQNEARPYREPTIPLQGEALSILKRDYGLSPAVIEGHGWRLTEHGEALVMPVRDRFGNTIGHITRTLEKQKRVMTYKATDRPLLDFWSLDGKVVIVEDCLSAARLFGCGIASVALLGTNMSTRDAQEIAAFVSNKNDPVYLALDADAWDKSVKIANRHAHILTMQPIPLTLDIKNMESDDEIKNLFGAG